MTKGFGTKRKLLRETFKVVYLKVVSVQNV